MTINVGNIRLWVDALRSGEYLQGRHMLFNTIDNTWCCLGVACDVARKNGVDLDAKNYDDTARMYFNDSADYLPAAVTDWLGVDGRDPDIGGTTATDMNDRIGADFRAIADAVENRYLKTGE